MSNVSLHQFLVLYTWFPLAAILLFMLLIGRFYQKFSGERTYYWLYTVPIVLFGAVIVRFASAGIILGDILGDAIAFVAGLFLLFLSILLYRLMMSSKHDSSP